MDGWLMGIDWCVRESEEGRIVGFVILVVLRFDAGMYVQIAVNSHCMVLLIFL